MSNRASTYLKLKQYEEALQDAEAYILQRPNCWRGYARKALALVELNDIQGACVAASLAYYYERNLFRDFEPFRTKFGSVLEKRLFVCRDTSDLSSALVAVKKFNNCRTLSSDNFKYLPVIILENSAFLVSYHTMALHLFSTICGLHILTIENCILLSCRGQCSVTFADNLNVWFCKRFVAQNVNFHSGLSNCHFFTESVVKLSHCSFQSSNPFFSSFCCKGKLKADFCKFYNCTKGGLLVVGDAEIENSEFFGNAMALEVREGGRLLVKKCSLYGNKMHGMLIGPEAKECCGRLQAL